MGSFLLKRQKMIALRGRSMTLRRQVTTSSVLDVTVQGFLTMYRPEQVGIGDVRQGDGSVAILNDEILAASWPGPIRARDQMVIDGRIWTVQGAHPLYEGDTCIGYTIFVRGG